MEPVYAVAVATTHFKRWPEESFSSLARTVVGRLLEDAALPRLDGLDSVHFGNCAMHAFGQNNIRGQVALAPLLRDGTVPPSVPIVNVEGGCATGSLALHGAWTALAAGDGDLALAIGVEKTFVPDPAQLMAIFDGGCDRFDQATWRQHLEAHAAACGAPFAPSPQRIVMLDVCAMQAAWHMRRYGTTREQLAAGAAKNHAHGALNPNAQYQKAMSVAEVLADKPVLGPLTRAMCAPISDGAAAVLLCSKAGLAALPEATRRRAVQLRAVALAGGRLRAPDETPVTAVAADRAWKVSGVTPAQVHVAEVHDATAFAEVTALESLGFVKPGEGGPALASGVASLGGARPVNTSGGLVSKGHPLGATGLAMVHEVVTQLRQEAGPRQVPNASVGVTENGGGQIGFDEAVCAVAVLTR